MEEKKFGYTREITFLDVTDTTNFLTYEPGDLVSLYFDHSTRFFHEVNIDSSRLFSSKEKTVIFPFNGINHYYFYSQHDEIKKTFGFERKSIRHGLILSPVFAMKENSSIYHRILLDEKFFWFSTLTIERKLIHDDNVQ